MLTSIFFQLCTRWEGFWQWCRPPIYSCSIWYLTLGTVYLQQHNNENEQCIPSEPNLTICFLLATPRFSAAPSGPPVRKSRAALVPCTIHSFSSFRITFISWNKWYCNWNIPTWIDSELNGKLNQFKTSVTVPTSIYIKKNKWKQSYHPQRFPMKTVYIYITLVLIQPGEDRMEPVTRIKNNNYTFSEIINISIESTMFQIQFYL